MHALPGPFKFIIVALLSLFLFSCGGGSSSDSPGTGTVALLITDGPSEEFKAINLNITKVELMSDSGRVTLFEGVKKFDLLQLANVTEIFSLTEVPVGSYDKIRLTLTSIELVLKADGSSVYPRLPGNGKLDLNPRGSFSVNVDTTLMIQLDIDAEKSIHIVKTGNGLKYQFRPVVFVKIITDAFDTKLVRLTGAVSNLDATGGTFDLCKISAQQVMLTDNDLPACVMINTVDAPSSFFDEKGNPTDINNLTNDDIATVVGHFSFDGPVASPLSIDMNGNMMLIAEVIWTGEYAQVLGIARSSVVADAFEYDVIPNKDYKVNGPVSTLLAPGTKIFSRHDGRALSVDDIQNGVPAKVDGVFQFSADTVAESLKAALIILDTKVALTQLSGIIGDIAPDYSSMMLQTDAGDRCINMVSTTKVFEITVDTDQKVSFRQVPGFALQMGQQASVFGTNDTDDSGCLKADTIIFESGAVIQPL